jgi:hypothetical protein
VAAQLYFFDQKLIALRPKIRALVFVLFAIIFSALAGSVFQRLRVPVGIKLTH